ncbi:D-tyrosyl-tRNA(Tyr) deacylase, partial [Lacticaseibacillus rhamnosus]
MLSFYASSIHKQDLINKGEKYMRAVVQRSLAAKVTIAGQTVGAIDHGFVVLLGVGPEDTSADSDYL